MATRASICFWISSSGWYSFVDDDVYVCMYVDGWFVWLGEVSEKIMYAGRINYFFYLPTILVKLRPENRRSQTKQVSERNAS